MTDAVRVTELRRGVSIRRGARDERREALLERLEEVFLADGFSEYTIESLCRRLKCSKTTLYSIASSREQIIQAVTRHFFARSTKSIEAEINKENDPARKIVTYLSGVGAAMSRNSPAFYLDMISYPATAEIYRLNSDAAARRVRSLIEDGVAAGLFRQADALFAAQAVALLIDGVQSGELLSGTGLTAGQAYAELANW